MANPEHVEIVKGGKDAIDQWRIANSGVRLDLEGADLTNCDLTRCDFSSAMLMQTNFSNSILSSADFFRAYLESAVFTNAEVDGASLVAATMINAILGDANLTKASLQLANLTGAHVASADFEGAAMGDTVLANLDLSTAKGLQGLRHDGPSVIDERTLRRSGPLPEVFLRGVGLSDQYIDYLPSLMGQAIEFYSCFISYSSKDDEFARRLHADMQANGVRCWFAPEDLGIGDKIRPSIEDAIRLHDKLLLILSENSVNSPWVEDEVESALEKERKAKERGEDRTVLFPIRLDSAVMDTDAAWAAGIRRTRHIGDFSDWKGHDAYQKAFERLLKDLKAGAKI